MAYNLKLGYDITSASWNGWKIRGKDTNHLIIEMIAKLNLSYRDIADVFGVSYQTICNRVAKFREQYPDKWEEATGKQAYYNTYREVYHDEEGNLSQVAKRLKISINQARALRSELIPRAERIKRVGIDSRQNILAHALFGYDYNAGDNFAENLEEWLKGIDKDARKMLREYYIEGVDTTREERFQRSKNIGLLRDYLLENNLADQIELVEKGILCQNKRL